MAEDSSLAPVGTIYRFGQFVLDPTARLVFHGEIPIELSGLRWKLLVHLVTNHPAAVSEIDLCDLLYPNERGDTRSRLKDVRTNLDRSLFGDKSSNSIVLWSKGHLKLAEAVQRILPVETKTLPTPGGSGEEGRQEVQVPISGQLPRFFGNEIAEFFKVLFGLLLRPKATLKTLLRTDRPDWKKALRFAIYADALALTLTRFHYQIPFDGSLISDFLKSLILYALVGVIFICGLLLMSPHEARLRVFAGACHILAAFLLASLAVAYVNDSAMLIYQLDCSGISADACNITSFLWDALHSGSDIVYPVGLEGFPYQSFADKRDFQKVLAVLFTTGSILFVWLGLAWNAMRSVLNSRWTRSVVSCLLTFVTVNIAVTAVFLFPEWLPGREVLCADHLPQVATLNTMPVSYLGAACHDYPVIDVVAQDSPETLPRRFSKSQAEHDLGRDVSTGSATWIKVYFHNGASGSSTEEQTARHVKVRLAAVERSDNEHIVSATLWADNVAKITSGDFGKGGNIVIRSVPAARLRFIKGSAFMCVSTDHAHFLGAEVIEECGKPCPHCIMTERLPIQDSVFAEGVDIGNVPPGYKFEGLIVAKFELVASKPD